MSYFVRYFATGQVPTLSELVSAAQADSPHLGMADLVSGPIAHADLNWVGEVFAEIEINERGSEMFEAEILEQLELIRLGRGKKTPIVNLLKEASCIIAVRILTSSGEFRELLDRVDPIWEWLDENRRGVTAFDSHGFYLDSRYLVKTS
jgi:hypothetical protein